MKFDKEDKIRARKEGLALIKVKLDATWTLEAIREGGISEIAGVGSGAQADIAWALILWVSNGDLRSLPLDVRYRLRELFTECLADLERDR